MQLTKDFVSLLQTTVTPTKVYPSASKSTALPAVVYSQRNGVRQMFYNGSYGLRETDFTVDIYAKTYGEAVVLKDALITTFHGLTGLMGTSMVGRSSISNTLESFEDNGEKIYRIIVEIKILD
tara:strand:- start:2898 stop:3266 length:369 start_codon:yes stop_codon:yes gene_type:complete